MTTAAAPLLPSQLSLAPPVHRGLPTLDRSLFFLEFNVLAARIPAARTGSFARKEAKESVLCLPKITVVERDPTSPDHRWILLNAVNEDQLPTELVQMFRADGITTHTFPMRLEYDYWTSDEILGATLPLELVHTSPTSFSQVGHIAHLNLKDEYLPHKHLIGQVILDKNAGLRTVVNKLNSIDNVYRNFAMEVLAGDDDYNVITSESNCTFKFDFSKVYWNSRLSTEHERLVASFKHTDVVCDAFAGVGPFAIPAGKKGCGVLASDLNPASASSLAENAKMNKVEETVRCANEDGRHFMRQSVLDLFNFPFPAYSIPIPAKARAKAARIARQPNADGSLPTPIPVVEGPKRNLIDHFVMNLPNSALEFLDAFRGIYRELLEAPGGREAVEERGEDRLPMVHCYCFVKGATTDAEAEADVLERATGYLGMPITNQTKDFKLRYVRDVAPTKGMYCLEFRLTMEMVR